MITRNDKWIIFETFFFVYYSFIHSFIHDINHVNDERENVAWI